MNGRGILTPALWIFFFLFASLLQSCSLHSKETTVLPPKVDVPVAVAPPVPELPYTCVDYSYPLWAVNKPKLYIYKGERKLLLVNGRVLIRDYPIALGFSPKGDKYVQGDGRTPEGEYLICVRNGTSKFYKSLGLNYPSPRHAETALSTGCISYDQYSKIKEANQCLVLPPCNTQLGGAIFIHGGGVEKDWTLGCIALNNHDMDEIFEVTGIGTPVVILP